MNRVILEGHLGQDAELRYMNNGNPVANFSLATSESYNDKNGDRKDVTEWHRIVVFGKLAEMVGNHARKGSHVLIEAKIKTRSYEKDGRKLYTTEIVLEQYGSTFKFLGPKPADADNRNNNQQRQPSNQHQPSNQQNQQPAPDDFNDDIPF